MEVFQLNRTLHLQFIRHLELNNIHKVLHMPFLPKKPNILIDLNHFLPLRK